jgi:hypothetical protein
LTVLSERAEKRDKTTSYVEQLVDLGKQEEVKRKGMSDSDDDSYYPGQPRRKASNGSSDVEDEEAVDEDAVRPRLNPKREQIKRGSVGSLVGTCGRGLVVKPERIRMNVLIK